MRLHLCQVTTANRGGSSYFGLPGRKALRCRSDRQGLHGRAEGKSQQISCGRPLKLPARAAPSQPMARQPSRRAVAAVGISGEIDPWHGVRTRRSLSVADLSISRLPISAPCRSDHRKSSRSDAIDKRQRRILLGEITGAHGIRGDVFVRSFTAAPEAIAAYGPLTDATGANNSRLASYA